MMSQLVRHDVRDALLRRAGGLGGIPEDGRLSVSVIARPRVFAHTQADRQTGRQTGRQADRQTDRQTDSRTL